MKKHCYRLTMPFLIMAFSFVLVTACQQPAIQTTHPSSKPASKCRVIQHTFGETCVPLNPQRIIALNPISTLDPLMALDVRPIGFASYNGSGEEVLLGVSFDEVEGVENVGDAFQPSLEKILMLKPDLILTTDYSDDEQKYKLLSEIAPTVSVPNESHLSPEDYENKPWFKENLQFVAKVLGQEAKAEEVFRQYQNRIEALKNRLGSQPHQIEISVIFMERVIFGQLVKAPIQFHIF